MPKKPEPKPESKNQSKTPHLDKPKAAKKDTLSPAPKSKNKLTPKSSNVSKSKNASASPKPPPEIIRKKKIVRVRKTKRKKRKRKAAAQSAGAEAGQEGALVDPDAEDGSESSSSSEIEVTRTPSEIHITPTELIIPKSCIQQKQKKTLSLTLRAGESENDVMFKMFTNSKAFKFKPGNGVIEADKSLEVKVVFDPEHYSGKERIELVTKNHWPEDELGAEKTLDRKDPDARVDVVGLKFVDDELPAIDETVEKAEPVAAAVPVVPEAAPVVMPAVEAATANQEQRTSVPTETARIESIEEPETVETHPTPTIETAKSSKLPPEKAEANPPPIRLSNLESSNQPETSQAKPKPTITSSAKASPSSQNQETAAKPLHSHRKSSKDVHRQQTQPSPTIKTSSKSAFRVETEEFEIGGRNGAAIYSSDKEKSTRANAEAGVRHEEAKISSKSLSRHQEAAPRPTLDTESKETTDHEFEEIATNLEQTDIAATEDPHLQEIAPKPLLSSKKSNPTRSRNEATVPTRTSTAESYEQHHQESKPPPTPPPKTILQLSTIPIPHFYLNSIEKHLLKFNITSGERDKRIIYQLRSKSTAFAVFPSRGSLEPGETEEIELIFDPEMFTGDSEIEVVSVVAEEGRKYDDVEDLRRFPGAKVDVVATKVQAEHSSQTERDDPKRETEEIGVGATRETVFESYEAPQHVEIGPKPTHESDAEAKPVTNQTEIYISSQETEEADQLVSTSPSSISQVMYYVANKSTQANDGADPEENAPKPKKRRKKSKSRKRDRKDPNQNSSKSLIASADDMLPSFPPNDAEPRYRTKTKAPLMDKSTQATFESKTEAGTRMERVEASMRRTEESAAEAAEAGEQEEIFIRSAETEEEQQRVVTSPSSIGSVTYFVANKGVQAVEASAASGSKSKEKKSKRKNSKSRSRSKKKLGEKDSGTSLPAEPETRYRQKTKKPVVEKGIQVSEMVTEAEADAKEKEEVVQRGTEEVKAEAGIPGGKEEVHISARETGESQLVEASPSSISAVMYYVANKSVQAGDEGETGGEQLNEETGNTKTDSETNHPTQTNFIPSNSPTTEPRIRIKSKRPQLSKPTQVSSKDFFPNLHRPPHRPEILIMYKSSSKVKRIALSKSCLTQKTETPLSLNILNIDDDEVEYKIRCNSPAFKIKPGEGKLRSLANEEIDIAFDPRLYFGGFSKIDIVSRIRDPDNPNPLSFRNNKNVRFDSINIAFEEDQDDTDKPPSLPATVIKHGSLQKVRRIGLPKFCLTSGEKLALHFTLANNEAENSVLYNIVASSPAFEISRPIGDLEHLEVREIEFTFDPAKFESEEGAKIEILTKIAAAGEKAEDVSEITPGTKLDAIEIFFEDDEETAEVKPNDTPQRRTTLFQSYNAPYNRFPISKLGKPSENEAENRNQSIQEENRNDVTGSSQRQNQKDGAKTKTRPNTKTKPKQQNESKPDQPQNTTESPNPSTETQSRNQSSNPTKPQHQPTDSTNQNQRDPTLYQSYDPPFTKHKSNEAGTGRNQDISQTRSKIIYYGHENEPTAATDPSGTYDKWVSFNDEPEKETGPGNARQSKH